MPRRNDGTTYQQLVESAVAGAARGVQEIRDSARPHEPNADLGLGLVGHANVAALLAVADRLDLLIGLLFDEGKPISHIAYEAEEEDR